MPHLRVLLLAILISTSLVPGIARAERQVHTVASGEYLGAIATRYGVSVTEIMTWNELETDRIGIGQRLVVSPEAPPETGHALEGWETAYVVLRGDNVTRIAERVGVSVQALREANPDVRPDRVRPGQRLRIVGGTRVVDHVVRRGETLARLATRYEVRHRDLMTWNPSLARRFLDTGMTVRIYTDVRLSRSESVGAPNAGSLEHGETLPAHRAYVVRDPARAFGTHETVQWIVEAFDVALDADPQMTRVRVHDLGVSGGGHLTGHRSHQSGRDADIAYYRRQCRDAETCFMNRTRPEDLDVSHQWRLFRYWLEHHVTTAIFVDYALQEPLYEYARTHGASSSELEAWFQYPRPVSQPAGIIRHFAGHDDHFHVRFICPTSDETCSEAVRSRPTPSRESPDLVRRTREPTPEPADAARNDREPARPREEQDGEPVSEPGEGPPEEEASETRERETRERDTRESERPRPAQDSE